MDGIKPCEREFPMTTPHPASLRRIAAVLALSVLPMIAFAEDAERSAIPEGLGTHPWKLAYARRIANEQMENREVRERFAKQSLREWKKRQRAKGVGQHARPASPDGSTPFAIDAAPLH